jgi:DDE_Tnp_1-associated
MEHPAFLRRFYRYENGIPSHDTLCDVFAALDPEVFKTCFPHGSSTRARPTPRTAGRQQA